MRDLSKYKREHVEKLDAITTTITIEKRQKQFIELHNLNLSKLVRDFLDQIMKGLNNENSEEK